MKLYHHIEDLLKDWNIHQKPTNPNILIFKIEDYFENKPFTFGPYKHDFFELSFGAGHDVDVKIGTTRFKPIKDAISFTSPYQITSWKVNRFNKNSLGYMILFKPQLLGSTLDKIDFYKQYPYFNLHTSPMLFLDVLQRNLMVGLMQTLYKEYNNPIQEGYQNIIASYLTILLEKIRGFFEQSTSQKYFPNRPEEIAFLFENVLKEKASYALKIRDYASILNISPSYLTEVVKHVTGKTAISIVQEYVILKAKSLLSQTNGPIIVIAEELGFTEASNFNTYFKKNTGITPNAYRRLP